MNNLQIINKETITTLELVEQINYFRSEIEGKKELKHYDLLKIIRNEFDEEIDEGKISAVNYRDKKGEERPMYNLTLSQAKQVLIRESKPVRKAVIKYIEYLELKLKGQQQLPSYQIEDPIERAKAWIREQEEKKLLEQTIEEQKPKVDIANKRLLKNGCYSITEVTKSLNLKRGQITRWAKANKYLHKTQIEINKKGEECFKMYDNGGFKCIGINEEGLKLINENLEEIKNI